MSNQAIAGLATVKGIIMAIILFGVAETTFVQGTITAVLSACVSGTFLLLSVHITSKKTGEKVEEVGKKVEEAKQVLDEKEGNGNGSS